MGEKIKLNKIDYFFLNFGLFSPNQETSINMSNITPGSYVWYTRKNCIVKVLEYDRCSDSYTIESKGKIIDTLARFIDTNIGSKCMIFHDEKVELEGKIAELESYVSNLKERNRAEKQKFETEKRAIDSYVSALVHERTTLEAEIKNLNEKVVQYRNKYESSVKSLLVKSEYIEETIIMNNTLLKKTEKFLWKDLWNNHHAPTINLYSDFKGLKDYLVKQYASQGHPSNYEPVRNQINNWFLQKNEYIVGVYFERPFTYNGKRELIFYTNYGNVISIQFSVESPGYIYSKKFENLEVNTILSSKMINLINKNISSSYDIDPYIKKKSGKELHDFIKDVVDM